MPEVLANLFMLYRAKAMQATAPACAVEVCQQDFYAGVLAAMEVLSHVATGVQHGTLTQEQAVAELDAINAELDLFFSEASVQ